MTAEEYQDMFEEESGIAKEAIEEMLAILYDTFGISSLCSVQEFLRAASKYFYPNGVVYPPNRKERRRNKWRD